MRGRVVLPLASILAMVTAVTLLVAAATVTDTGGEPLTADRNKAVVRAFYEAVNTAIRAGDRSSLARVVSDEVIVHRSAAGDIWDRDALWLHLADVRAASPDLRILIEDVLADRNRVIARIRLSGVADGARLAVPQAVGTDGTAIDTFRVEDGLIVEYGGASADLGPAQPLLSTEFRRDFNGPALLGLARLSFDGGARIPVLVGPSPTIYVAEAGELTVRIDGVGILTRAATEGASPTPEQTIRGQSVTLGPGDQIAIGPGVSYSLSAERAEGSVALAASLLPIATLEPPGFSNAGIAPEIPLSVAMFGVPAGNPTPGPMGVRIRPLLAGIVSPAQGSPLAVSFQSVTLLPGTTIREYAAESTEFIAVESGSALLTSIARPLTGLTMPSTSSPEASSLEREASVSVLPVGTTAMVNEGQHFAIRSAGDLPLTVVVALVGA